MLLHSGVAKWELTRTTGLMPRSDACACVMPNQVSSLHLYSLLFSSDETSLDDESDSGFPMTRLFLQFHSCIPEIIPSSAHSFVTLTLSPADGHADLDVI